MIDFSKKYDPFKYKGTSHIDFHKSPSRYKLIGGAMGGSKALALDTLIPTPNGWKPMQEICIGDYIFGMDGNKVKVVWCSDIFLNHDCFKVTFSDNTEIKCDAGHLWLTKSRDERIAQLRRSDKFRAKRKLNRPSRAIKNNKQWLSDSNRNREYAHLPIPAGTVRTTQELFETLRAKDNSLNHTVDLAKPINTSYVNLPIAPYILGLWLGDGTSRSGGFTTADEQIIEEIKNCGYECKKWSGNYSWGIAGLFVQLKEIGLIQNKHIPVMYLRSSIQSRIDLLQGLMDTDGSCNKQGQCSYVSISKKLIDSVSELLSTLGIKHTIRKRDAKLQGRIIGDVYSIKFLTDIPVFRLKRKAERQKINSFRGTHNVRYIKSIERIESIPVKCITVENVDGMFLCGKHFIPTHNSVSGCAEGIQLSLDVPGNRGVIVRKNRTVLKRTTMVTFFQICPPEIIASFNQSELSVKLINGSEIIFLEADESKDPLFEKLKSLEIGWYFIDEGSEVARGAHQTLASRLRWKPANGRYYGIIASNPEECWVKEDFPVHATSKPKPEHSYFQFLPEYNPYLPLDYIDSLKLIYDENQQRKYIFGDWGIADSPMQVIPYTAIKNKFATQEEIETAKGEYALGVDVAELGDDKTKLVFMRGAVCTSIETYEKKRIDEVSDIVRARIVEHSIDADKVGIDAIGNGAGVWGNLVGAGFNVQRIIAGETPAEMLEDFFGEQKFFNLKAQMWWKVRLEVLNPEGNLRILNDPKLIQDLTTVRYKVKSERSIAIESKDEIKKRIGRSPDDAEAFVIANWVREIVAVNLSDAKMGQTESSRITGW